MTEKFLPIWHLDDKIEHSAGRWKNALRNGKEKEEMNRSKEGRRFFICSEMFFFSCVCLDATRLSNGVMETRREPEKQATRVSRKASLQFRFCCLLALFVLYMPTKADEPEINRGWRTEIYECIVLDAMEKDHGDLHSAWQAVVIHHGCSAVATSSIDSVYEVCMISVCRL